MTEVSAHTLQRFRGLIGEQTGLSFDDDKDALLREIIGERARRLELDADAYCAWVEQRLQHEVSALAEKLTVSETYFFRNAPHFEALRLQVIPECVAKLPGDRKLRVLSAGCATGEEPYSLAMLLDQLNLGERAEVTGFDLNPASIEKARRGVYGAWSLRETGAVARARWFVSDGREHLLNGALRARVTLTEHSLMRSDPTLLRSDHYDIILCRNVLMYFAPEAMRAAVARLTHALRPGGFLFLGHAETLRGVSHEFHLCHTHDTFYYQRKFTADHGSADHGSADHGNADHGSADHGSAVQAVTNGDWVGAIDRASAKIALLVPASHALKSEAPPLPAFRDRAAVIDLMRHERSDQALQLLRQGQTAGRTDPDTCLLEAALLLQQGDMDAAEVQCRRLLELDELSAGAHYILALCEERRGQLELAIHHDETAAYLDPTFAMPHVHLGLMLRRAGRTALAKKELSRAHTLLETEDVARLILFGGGFERDALKALCRAELAAVEVQRD